MQLLLKITFKEEKMQDFINNLNWMMLLKAFVVGGAICIVGQILIDKTKLTPARILVTFVTLGAILGGLGIYQKLVDFAGAGATVPLTGFGNLLAKGAIKMAKTEWSNWSLHRRHSSRRRWNLSSNIFWIYSFTCGKA